MRLQQFINESKKVIYKEQDEEVFDNIKTILKRDCIQYLKMVKNTFAYRYDMNTLGFFYKKDIRENRKPKDMPIVPHKIFDDLFYKYFKWRVRSNGIFTLAVKFHFLYDIVSDNISLFFPIGKFDYIYNLSISDLYDEWTIDLSEQDMENIVKGYIINKGFNNINDRAVEIIWRCQSYYMLNVENMERDMLFEFVADLVN